MSTKTKSSFASRLKALLGLAEGAEVKALSVTIVAGPDGTAGKTLDIETVGDNGITVGDPATIEGAEAPDGNYELSDQTKVVITAGAVSEIPPADEEVISEDEPEASTEETVTISKAEYDQFLADRIQASTNVSASADLAKLQGRIKTALGGRDLTAFESQDVIIPKGGKSSTSVSPEARSTPKGKEMTPGEAAIARREERKASAKK